MNLLKRTTLIKLNSEPFTLDTVIDVSNLKELAKVSPIILESEKAYYSFNAENQQFFRLRKPNFQPQIRAAEQIEYSPDMNCYVTMTREALVKLATETNFELLETPDGHLIILTNGIVFKTK